MKYIVLFFLIITATFAQAEPVNYWYISGEDGKVISKITYAPDSERMKDYVVTKSTVDIDLLDADVVDGQVVRHVMTKEEVMAANKKQQDAVDKEKIFKRGKAKLKALGLDDAELDILLGVN